nr:MAG TPA: hypothetical protein [Caudoviricetes sp.]
MNFWLFFFKIISINFYQFFKPYSSLYSFS